MKAVFELTEELKPLHKIYLEEFVRKNDFRYPIEIKKIEYDPLIKILNLPKISEFFLRSSLFPMKTWTPKTHILYTKKFDDIALTLLCIHRFHIKYIDKNIFLMLLSILAKDPIYYLEKNTDLVSFNKLSCYDKAYISQPEFFDLTPYEKPRSGVKIIFNDTSFSIKSIDVNGWAKFIQNKFLIPWNYLSTYKINLNTDKIYLNTDKIYLNTDKIYLNTDKIYLKLHNFQISFSVVQY